MRCPPLLLHARPDSGPGLWDTVASPGTQARPPQTLQAHFPGRVGFDPLCPPSRCPAWGTDGVDREARLLRRRGPSGPAEPHPGAVTIGLPPTAPEQAGACVKPEQLSCSEGEGPPPGPQLWDTGHLPELSLNSASSEKPPLVTTGLSEAPPLPASRKAPPGPLQPSMDLGQP